MVPGIYRNDRSASICWILGLAALCVMLAASPLRAQKAEPLRIRFPRGASGTVVKGALKDRQQTEYVLKAAKGQTVNLRLQATPPGTGTVKMLGGNGEELPLIQVSANRWRFVLQETGDLVMIVRRKSDQRGRLAYSLSLDVR